MQCESVQAIEIMDVYNKFLKERGLDELSPEAFNKACVGVHNVLQNVEVKNLNDGLLHTVNVLSRNDLYEFIEALESTLDEYNIVLVNSEKEEYMKENEDDIEAANIFGSDCDELEQMLREVFERWGITVPEDFD